MIRFLEICWLVIAIGAAFTGIYHTVTRGFSESYVFFIIAFIAAIFFSIRRKQRLKG
jgi:hypothetical protein